MGKKPFIERISFRAIIITVMSVVFASALGCFIALEIHTQRQQSEDAMLEEARVFSREMDAVWKFIDYSQPVINGTSDGSYEFKGLHCSIVGKSVGRLFSVGSDYNIRYTNFNPRSYLDEPDEFEAQALRYFDENPGSREYYGTEVVDGQEKFRYLKALEVDQSCLECHGEPIGELDITGHEKEGWTLDSVGGAISISIPTEQRRAAEQANILRDAVFFLMLTVLAGAALYVAISYFVHRPLDRMQVAFAGMRHGDLGISMSKKNAPKEFSMLVDKFNEMSDELEGMYSSIENQVEERTRDLVEAMAMLERQRGDLEELNKRLADETRFKTDLLSMVNHELRTPLTAIITLAQISIETSELDERALSRMLDAGGQDGGFDSETHGRIRILMSRLQDERSTWQEVEKNSQVLLTMINDMLDIARSDAGVITTACEPMDLGDIVQTVRQSMLPLARKYEVGFTTSVAADVPLVMGDFDKMIRVLTNLVSNAIKFTPDGGTVRLSVQRDGSNGDVLAMVADTGIGIAYEDQERIFERFVQVDSTSTRKYNGSGLGLAIVKEYAELQGFEVGLESAVGQGARFTVRIPSSSILSEGSIQ